MEADRRHTTTGVENLESCLQSLLDLAELVIDGYAQALKRSRRDVDVARPGSARDRRLHGLHQVARGAERAPRHDELCDPVRPALLAVLTEDSLDLRRVVLVDDLRGGERRLRVHAHVERSVGAEAESALRLVELRAGDAEVEEDHVRGVKTGGRRQLRSEERRVGKECRARMSTDE